MKIIDYGVVSGTDTEKLSIEVYNLIRDGWQPFGSLAMNKSQMLQPMVKYEEAIDEDSQNFHLK